MKTYKIVYIDRFFGDSELKEVVCNQDELKENLDEIDFDRWCKLLSYFEIPSELTIK